MGVSFVRQSILFLLETVLDTLNKRFFSHGNQINFFSRELRAFTQTFFCPMGRRDQNDLKLQIQDYVLKRDADLISIWKAGSTTHNLHGRSPACTVGYRESFLQEAKNTSEQDG